MDSLAPILYWTCNLALSFHNAPCDFISSYHRLPRPATGPSTADIYCHPAYTADSGRSPPHLLATSVGVPTPNPVIPPSYGATPIGVPATQSQGLILSPALEPIPARLVGRIASGQFVEMRDLLSDNIALHDQLEAVQGMHYAPNSVRPRLREVPSLTSYVFCFTAYIATRTTDPLTRDMLAYCRLIIREALRHGGTGWQEYDRNFRRQVAINPAIAWNTMLPDLQATTMLGQREGGGTFCHLCMGMDHSASHCALTYIHETADNPPSISMGTACIPPLSSPLHRLSEARNPAENLRFLEHGPMLLSRLVHLSAHLFHLPAWPPGPGLP